MVPRTPAGPHGQSIGRPPSPENPNAFRPRQNPGKRQQPSPLLPRVLTRAEIVRVCRRRWATNALSVRYRTNTGHRLLASRRENRGEATSAVMFEVLAVVGTTARRGTIVGRG